MRVHRGLSLKSRLTLAFLAGAAFLMVASASLIYVNLSHEIDATIDAGLTARADDIRSALDNGEALVSRGEAFAQVIDPTGRVLASSRTLDASEPVLDADEIQPALRGRTFVDRQVPGLGRHARLLAVPHSYKGHKVIVVVGGSLEAVTRARHRLQSLLTFATPPLVAVLAVGARLITTAALRPVERMSAEAELISLSEPGRRLPPLPGDDEISHLGRTLNAMLGRIEASFARERAFVDDASHELRTPLAILRAELEVALSQPGDAQETRQTLQSALEETQRLQHLAEELLELARAGTARPPHNAGAIDALAVVERTASRAAAVAGDTPRVEVIGTPSPAVVSPGHLDRIAANLLTNAFRYARGRVEISVGTTGAWTEVQVADDGPGFPEPFLPVAFDRFTRSDAVRGRAAGGAGLGLAIVAALVESYGGKVEAANGKPLGGAVVTVRLPSGAQRPT